MLEKKVEIFRNNPGVLNCTHFWRARWHHELTCSIPKVWMMPLSSIATLHALLACGTQSSTQLAGTLYHNTGVHATCGWQPDNTASSHIYRAHLIFFHGGTIACTSTQKECHTEWHSGRQRAHGHTTSITVYGYAWPISMCCCYSLTVPHLLIQLYLCTQKNRVQYCPWLQVSPKSLEHMNLR